jgi:hypothetical protein
MSVWYTGSGFLSGTPFGTMIGILFTAWWLHRTRLIRSGE